MKSSWIEWNHRCSTGHDIAGVILWNEYSRFLMISIMMICVYIPICYHIPASNADLKKKIGDTDLRQFVNIVVYVYVKFCLIKIVDFSYDDTLLWDTTPCQFLLVSYNPLFRYWPEQKFIILTQPPHCNSNMWGPRW